MTSMPQQAPELNPPPIPSSSHVVISGVDTDKELQVTAVIDTGVGEQHRRQRRPEKAEAPDKHHLPLCTLPDHGAGRGRRGDHRSGPAHAWHCHDLLGHRGSADGRHRSGRGPRPAHGARHQRCPAPHASQHALTCTGAVPSRHWPSPVPVGSALTGGDRWRAPPPAVDRPPDAPSSTGFVTAPDDLRLGAVRVGRSVLVPSGGQSLSGRSRADGGFAGAGPVGAGPVGGVGVG